MSAPLPLSSATPAADISSRLQPQFVFCILGLGLVLSLLISLQLGAVSVTWDDLATWWQEGQGQMASGPMWVLLHLRVPRALFALLVGAALGLSGALTQGLFRNPLADPGLLGISGGAACAAALGIVLCSGWAMYLPPDWRIWFLPLLAFGGALGVCFTLDKLARWLSADSISGLLLTGIALNALTSALIGLCTYMASDEQLRSLSFWTLGSLAAGNWQVVGILLLLVAGAWFMTRRLQHALNALALGEAAAAHVGVNVSRLRGHIVLLVALLSGFVVAWCGVVAFIGLVAPHLARCILGADQRLVLPTASLLGAGLLLLADTFARTVAIPAEVPVGIFTALIGTPFFLVLLNGLRNGRRYAN